MKKETNSELVVKIKYKDNGIDIKEILNDSILLYITNKVKEICDR